MFCLLFGVAVVSAAYGDESESTPELESTSESTPADEVPDTSLGNAHVVYDQRYADAKAGVYADGDVLFVVVEFAVEGRSDNARRTHARFVFRDTLRAYAAQTYAEADADTPPSPAVVTAFPKLMPLLRVADPSLGVFPLNYNGPSRVLVNRKKGDDYRYVVALPVEKLEASLPGVRHAVPDTAAVERALQGLRKQLEREGKLTALYAVLPLPEDRLRLANAELQGRLNADSLCWGAVDPQSLYAAYARLAAMETSVVESPPSEDSPADAPPSRHPPTLDAMFAALGGVPAPSRVLTAVADASGTSAWSTLNARLLALTDDDTREAVLKQLAADNTLTAEYAAWQAGLVSRPWAKLLQNVSPGPVTTAAWRTLGHANFPANAPAAETPEYREARKLYLAGKELPRLAGLLLRSVESSPRHADSWRLLGDALRAAGTPEDAVWPLSQALRLAPDNADTRASLAIVYQAIGRDEWAAGMAVSVFAIPDASEWGRKKAAEILEAFNVKNEKGETP